jgi:tetratricopeptide (TPR) repeat protein
MKSANGFFTCLIGKKIAMVVSIAWALFVASAALGANRPWDGLPFSADPTALVVAAQSELRPDGAEVLVLLDEEHDAFDAQGRDQRTWHLVYEVVTQAGVENRASVATTWEPWHQERPTIRARVITPDGAIHALDPKTIEEAAARDDQRDVFTDRRLLRAPLPAVATGAVVEEEIAVRETASIFDRGVVHHCYFGKDVPVEEKRLVIEAPVSQPLRYLVRLLPSVAPQKTESDGRLWLVFESGPMAAIKTVEPLMPGDVPQWPEVIFSTGSTWQDVATEYAAMVDEQIRSADMKDLVDGVEVGNMPRQEIVAALNARLHREVRYTGVEFGEASLMPRTPSETLKRKYGDCKDKAALMIAMLRAAEIPAHMVLLNTAPDGDPESELPGLGDFDHAIVLAPGTPDLWIDPTDEFARVGSLPLEDQGRLALVVSPETTALVRTPASRSTDNRSIETREVFLAELGLSRIVETTEAWGSIEEGYRAGYRKTDSKELRQELEDYVKSSYVASLTGYRNTDPRDFSTPFQLRLEMDHSAVAVSSRTGAVVAIPLRHLADRLPDVVRQAQSEGNAASPASEVGSKVQTRRRSDVDLPEPYVLEWRYRIVPPPGFMPQPLPEGGQEQLGPALLTKKFAAETDGVVTVTVRFDTVKRRLTPDEFEALRQGVVKMQEAPPVLVKFEQIGEVDLKLGKVREALDEFNKLVALHPHEGLHHAQVATGLLAAGIGEAARAEAQCAIQLDPKSAAAYQTLGWVLQHDLVGRRFGKGFDLAGAEAAYRKAIELDPSDRVTVGNLAILLEHNPKGERYGPGARLEEAIRAYRSLGDDLKETGLEDNLLFALVWAGKFNDLRESVLKLQPTATRRVLQLVAIAATEGAKGAVSHALRDIPEDEARRQALQQAAQILFKLRLYPPAADLLAASAQGTPDAASVLARASLIRNLVRHEDLPLSANDPGTVVKKFFIQFLSGDLNEGELSGIFRRQGVKEAKAEGFGEAEKAMRAIGLELNKAGLGTDVVVDFALTATRMTVEGDDTSGYRVRIEAPTSGGEAGGMIFFVVREAGQYRILDAASGAGDGFEAMGDEVLERVEKGDLQSPRRLLDWVREEQTPGGGDDPLGGHAFPRLWTKGQQGDREALRYAAAAIVAAGSEENDTAIAILREGREKAASDGARLNFDLALAQGLMKSKKYVDLLPVAQRLAASSPDSPTAFRLLAGAQTKLKRWEECEKAAEERLKRLPDDRDAIRVQMTLAAEKGDIEEAQQFGRKLVTLGKATPVDLNNLAWCALVSGRVDEDAIQIAQRAVLSSHSASPAALHTLASLYAEVGKTTEARQVLLQAMDVEGLEEPDEKSWYVFGRITEQFGVFDAAAAEYRKLKPPKEDIASPSSTYLLAQRRLKVLDANRLARAGVVARRGLKVGTPAF